MNNEPIEEYPWHGPFAHSMRCSQCRNEVPHTREEHDILRHSIIDQFGWPYDQQYRNQMRHRHGAQGDLWRSQQ